MEARTYNSLIGRVHHSWGAEVLGMEVNPGIGADLRDDEKVVELKFCLVRDENSYVNWKILNHQLEYGRRSRIAYWGLATYELSKPVRDIEVVDASDLEEFVTERELWLVPWTWINKFKVYHETGEGYDNHLRFAKRSALPKITESKKVRGGLVHLTKGVDPNRFPTISSKPDRSPREVLF